MPQPYFGNWQSTQNSLAERPILAAHVGIIAALWAHVEYRLALLMALILHIDAEVAMVMYAPVRSEAARLAIIEAIVKDRLSEERLTEFQKLRKRVKSTGDERDKIVHGLWGIPENVKDSLIWYDGTKSVEQVSGIISRLARTEKKTYKPPKRGLMTALEYKVSDFIDIEKRIQERIAEIVMFGATIERKFPAQ